MKRLLVTGASGFLGWNISQIAISRWTVFGAVFTNPPRISGVTLVQSDLTNYGDLKHLFYETKPDAVIHTAAVNDANVCQNDRSRSNKINVEAAINIAGLCSAGSRGHTYYHYLNV
jgi:dTDP-4-dehydrorhamnose reductase